MISSENPDSPSDRPEIENEGVEHDWKLEEIQSYAEETISELEDDWNLDIEPRFAVQVGPGLGAYVSEDLIRVSEPDIYRVAMHNFIDGENYPGGDELVDKHYPAPFHELNEEIGQWLGRKTSNNWRYERAGSEQSEIESMANDVRDELHGLMAIKTRTKGFLPAYMDIIRTNTDIIAGLNSEDQIDVLLEADSTEAILEDYGFKTSDLTYSRGPINRPEPFARTAARAIEDNTEFRIENIDYDTLEGWRTAKKHSEMKNWAVYLAAEEARQELESEYTQEQIVKGKTDIPIDRVAEQKYGEKLGDLMSNN